MPGQWTQHLKVKEQLHIFPPKGSGQSLITDTIYQWCKIQSNLLPESRSMYSRGHNLDSMCICGQESNVSPHYLCVLPSGYKLGICKRNEWEGDKWSVYFLEAKMQQWHNSTSGKRNNNLTTSLELTFKISSVHTFFFLSCFTHMHSSSCYRYAGHQRIAQHNK